MKSATILYVVAASVLQAEALHSHHSYHSHRHLHPRTSGKHETSRKGYTTTFFDDFGGAANSLPSSENWIIDLGTSYPGGQPRWGNNENQVYTDSTENLYITADKTLAIIPRHSIEGPWEAASANSSGNEGNWTSARIETQRSDFAAVPGGKLFIESRIKLGAADPSLQKGIWPAFWALGESFRGVYNTWPMASEWDFMEVINGIPIMYSTLHCGTAPGGPCEEYTGLGTGGIPYTMGEFRTIGFEVDRSMVGTGKNGTWLEETLSWFLDGREILKINGSRVGDEPTWQRVAHDGHFVLLNVAVGGNWPGWPNSSTIDGPDVGMEVDYVGVWNSE